MPRKSFLQNLLMNVGPPNLDLSLDKTISALLLLDTLLPNLLHKDKDKATAKDKDKVKEETPIRGKEALALPTLLANNALLTHLDNRVLLLLANNAPIRLEGNGPLIHRVDNDRLTPQEGKDPPILQVDNAPPILQVDKGLLIDQVGLPDPFLQDQDLPLPHAQRQMLLETSQKRALLESRHAK
jgi:hypothetical protein